MLTRGYQYEHTRAALMLIMPVALAAAGLTFAAIAEDPPTPEPFTVEIEGTTVSFEMVPVPRGDVTLGSGEDARDVSVEAFWMGRTEVTWDALDIFVYRLDAPDDDADADATSRPSKPYISMDRGYGHAGFPAISMSHETADAYCEWLSEKTGHHFRLPTYAEWRHAARLSGLDDAAELEQRAWYRANAKYATHAVGSKEAGDLGIHDLFGNAAEWTMDDGYVYTIAGGSYRDPVERVGPTARQTPNPDWNASDPQIPKSRWWLADAPFVGFRLVCEDKPAHGEESSGD